MIPPVIVGVQPITVFDFDETLTQKNTLIPYAKCIFGSNLKLGVSLSKATVLGLIDSALQPKSLINPSLMVQQGYLSAIKYRLKDAIRYRLLDEIARVATPEKENFAAKQLHSKFEYIKETVELLYKHANEHEVWIATGSSKEFVEGVAKLNGWPVTKVIGTDIYTESHFAKAECIRANKLNLIRECIPERYNIQRAYGNFPDDSHMVDLAINGYFVAKDMSISEVQTLY